MINKLYKDIAAGLRKIKSCRVYVEDVPQNFAQPSFLISFYEQNPSRGINGRLKNTVNVDVSYFPESRQDVNEESRQNVNEECWEVGQNLLRELRIEDFKIKNRNLKITDKVLHFMFDVYYREYLSTDSQTMQTLSQDTDIKEE